MNNKSTMNLIRHYCKLHKDQIFDVEVVNRCGFSDVPSNIFRKYVSRLVEEHYLTQVSKGVYFASPSLPNNIADIVLNNYYDGVSDRLGKESLLYSLNIIENKPEITTIYKSWKKGNKRILNIQIIEAPYVDYWNRYFASVLELIDCEKLVSEDDKPAYVAELFKLLTTIKEFKIEKGLVEQYPRIVFSRLANLLNQLHISNTVMQDYEDKVRCSNRY